jgi:TolA-binding protein
VTKKIAPKDIIMKLSRLLILIAVIAVSFTQCKPDPRARITELEKKISSEDFAMDEKGMQTANELIDAYLAYAESQKDSPEAPEYLYKAADLSLNLNKSKEALDLYNRIIYQYPDFKKDPECLFLMGYIYENHLQNYGKAKEIYEQFIKKYPTHDFADDAAISIENMGMSPEELIRKFEAKNKASKDSISL